MMTDVSLIMDAIVAISKKLEAGYFKSPNPQKLTVKDMILKLCEI